MTDIQTQKARQTETYKQTERRKKECRQVGNRGGGRGADGQMD